MRYAVVQSGTVVNLIVWDGVTAWQPPVGTDAVHVENGEWVDIGANYDAKGSPRFTPPEVEA